MQNQKINSTQQSKVNQDNGSLQNYTQQTNFYVKVQRKEEPQQNQNPIMQFGLNLYQQQFVTEKTQIDIQNHKSRGMKRKQKLQKIRTELKDPQMRRQRNRQRHAKAKQKLQKHLQTLEQSQIDAYLKFKKFQRKQTKARVKKAVQDQIGQPFLIDIAYQHQMSQKQNKSLAMQIQLIIKTLKRIAITPNIHLCGVSEGKFKDQLVKMKYQYWPMKSYETQLEDCLKLDKFKGKNVYYLSPDAPKTVNTIGKDDVFIIGGLVDRTVIKYASLNRAEKLGIEARSLPIRPFMKQRTCLNLDHIVSIICKFTEVNDWKEAFEYGAPKRWKKEEGQKGLKQLKQDSSQENQIENQENQDNQEQLKNQKVQKYQESKEVIQEQPKQKMNILQD